MRERELNKIRENNKKLNRLQRRYETIRRSSLIPGKEIKEILCQSSGNMEDPNIRSAEEAYDIETEYQMIYWNNERIIRMAREYINSLPDPILRMLLELTYINCMDEYEVASAAGMRKQDCDVILKVHFNNVF